MAGAAQSGLALVACAVLLVSDLLANRWTSPGAMLPITQQKVEPHGIMEPHCENPVAKLSLPIIQQKMEPHGEDLVAKVTRQHNMRFFLHIFKGEGEHFQKVAICIVKEQMMTIQSALPNSFEVYFTTVGTLWDDSSINNSGLNCSTCYRGAHLNQGWETDTQQALFEYCHNNPAEQVAYIHTKGSYHADGTDAPHGTNHGLRRFLMKGVTSKECLTMTANCNVCSSRFSPMPHPHTPGNMWQAKCSYIRKLAPPKFFEHNMSLVFAMEQRPFDGDWAIGSGRYAAERWVHSHPDVEPCDIYAGGYSWGYGLEQPQVDGTWVPQLYTGIRFPLSMYWDGFSNWQMWVRWRCREWMKLYHKLPTPNEMKKTWRFQEALANVDLPEVCSP